MVEFILDFFLLSLWLFAFLHLFIYTQSSIYSHRCRKTQKINLKMQNFINFFFIFVFHHTRDSIHGWFLENINWYCWLSADFFFNYRTALTTRFLWTKKNYNFTPFNSDSPESWFFNWEPVGKIHSTRDKIWVQTEYFSKWLKWTKKLCKRARSRELRENFSICFSPGPVHRREVGCGMCTMKPSSTAFLSFSLRSHSHSLIAS